MPWCYINRNDFKTRLGDTLTADDSIYRSVLEAVSRAIDNFTWQQFRIFLATRYFTPVDASYLSLDIGLVSMTTLKTDEDGDRTYESTWAATDYDLTPFNALSDQSPYRRISITPEGNFDFPRSLAKSVEIAGKWGWYEDLLTSSATLAEDLDSSETGVDVSDGAQFKVLQTILIDSEQMYITAISSNTLTVERAVNGTTAATHANGAAIKIYRYPGPVVEACVIQSSRIFKRKEAPFGVVGGSDIQAARNIPELDPDVKQLLAPYCVFDRSFA